MKKFLKSSFSILLALAICTSMLVGLNITAQAATKEITFELGANGTAHNDGSSKTTYTETVNGYTLSIANGVQFYTGACDAKGNSAFKLGSSSKVGSFTISNIPADVTEVVILVAKYKTNTTKITVNNTAYTISSSSNNGAYDTITVNTSTTKTVSFTTVSGGVRCMINSIIYKVEDTSGDGEQDFTVTAVSNNESYGTVAVSGGTIVATPKTGYKIAGYEVTSGTATVEQNDNVFTVEATEDVLITINFAALEQYTVTFQEADDQYTQTVYEGTEITLAYHKGAMDAGVTFSGWTASGTSYNAGATYTVNSNVTFVAKYGTTTGEHKATITFDKAVKRTELDNSKQVWIENGVTVTNNKGKSTTNVAAYEDPARFYKSSSLIISYVSNVSKIVVNTNTESTEYAAALKSSITDTNATVAASGYVVTITLNNPVSTFSIAQLSAQVRVDSIVVYPTAPSVSGSITGAQVSIGENLSIDYYTEIENLGDNEPQMQFTIGDDDAIVVDTYTVIDGKYVFTFAGDDEQRKGIAPQRMCDIIVAELIVDGEVIATKNNYSIKANAQELIEDYANDDKLIQLVSDMLNYGAAAQKYRGYNTDNLATTGIEGLVSSNNVPDKTDFELTPATSEICFKSASIYFADVNKIIVKLKSYTENTTLKIDDVGVELIDGAAMTEGIMATEFARPFEFTLYENGELVQTLTYSINSYVYSKQNSESMGELALALYNYGKSAEEYANK